MIATKALVLYWLVTRFWDSAWVSHLVQDIRTWQPFFESAKQGLVPYVHFTKEYPVLGGLLYWAMTPFVEPADLRRTVMVHAAFSLVADVANTLLFHRLARAVSPRHADAATLLVILNPTALVMTPVRFEGYVTTFALLGYLAAQAGHGLRAAVAWAVGCGLKWYPAFFLAAREWRVMVEERRVGPAMRAGLAFLAAFAALNLPFALLAWRNGALENWTDPYLFHVRRPLYWDTLLGVLQVWLGPLAWERHAGTWSLALMLVAVVARPRLPLPHRFTLICLAGVVFNRIYSAQFNLWLYPFLALAALEEAPARRKAILVLAVALDLLNVAVFPTTFTPALDEMQGFFPYAARQNGGPWTVAFSAAIALRAVVIVALAVVLLKSGRGGNENTRDPQRVRPR